MLAGSCQAFGLTLPRKLFSYFASLLTGPLKHYPLSEAFMVYHSKNYEPLPLPHVSIPHCLSHLSLIYCLLHLLLISNPPSPTLTRM